MATAKTYLRDDGGTGDDREQLRELANDMRLKAAEVEAEAAEVQRQLAKEQELRRGLAAAGAGISVLQQQSPRGSPRNSNTGGTPPKSARNSNGGGTPSRSAATTPRGSNTGGSLQLALAQPVLTPVTYAQGSHPQAQQPQQQQQQRHDPASMTSMASIYSSVLSHGGGGTIASVAAQGATKADGKHVGSGPRFVPVMAQASRPPASPVAGLLAPPLTVPWKQTPGALGSAATGRVPRLALPTEVAVADAKTPTLFIRKGHSTGPHEEAGLAASMRSSIGHDVLQVGADYVAGPSSPSVAAKSHTEGSARAGLAARGTGGKFRYKGWRPHSVDTTASQAKHSRWVLVVLC